MDKKIQRLKGWASGEEKNPYRLEIHPTNRCNLKCRMCGTRTAWKEEEGEMKEIIKENKQRELSDDRWLRLVEEAVDMGVERILLTGGGEPFIRKNLILEMMEKIKSHNIFGNINTNGTLLEEEDVRKIVDMNWDLVMFSIDSPHAETHDFIRNQKGTFNKGVKNLLRFKRYKDKLNSERPEIALNSVLTEKNYRQLPELVKFASKVGCNDLTLFPLIDADKHPELKIQNGKSFNKKLEEAQVFARRENLHTNLNAIKRENEQKGKTKGGKTEDNKRKRKTFADVKCFEPFLNIVVKMDGELTPCCMIEESRENIKNSSLKDAWHGKYYENLRENFKKGEVPEICSTCILQKENRNEDIQKKLARVLEKEN